MTHGIQETKSLERGVGGREVAPGCQDEEFMCRVHEIQIHWEVMAIGQILIRTVLQPVYKKVGLGAGFLLGSYFNS